MTVEVPATPGWIPPFDVPRLLDVVLQLVPFLGDMSVDAPERSSAVRALRFRLPDGTEATLPEIAEVVAERHVHTLVGRGSVDEARRFLGVLEAHDPLLSVVQRWKRVLERPAAGPKPDATGRDPRPDMDWLRHNGHRYAGRWVALKNGVLLDSDVAARALAQRLSAGGSAEGIVVMKVPD